jgi:hypothetical protein
MGVCSSTSSSGGGPVAMNEADLNILKSRITRKMMTHSNQATKKVVSRQNITIREKERNGPLSPFYYKEINLSKGPGGSLGKREGCAVFGCSYDITQTGNFNINTFNSNIVDETNTIFADIESAVEQRAAISLEGNPSGLDAAARAISGSSDIVKEKISSILSNISKEDFENDQNILIEYISPPRCKNPCGFDGPTLGPILKQDAQTEIYSTDIINSVLDIYETNLQKHGLEADQTIETTNHACILLMVAVCIGLAMVVMILKFVLSRMS